MPGFRMATVPDTPGQPSVQMNALHRLLNSRILQCVILVGLLASIPLVEAVRLHSLEKASNWLQLQAGNWIIVHHAVPSTGIFSQSPDLPWADPNWGLQFALAALNRVIGPSSIPVTAMMLRLLLAVVTFILAGGQRGNFWAAAALTLWLQAALLGSDYPLGTLCSAVLFAIELLLLLRSCDPGRQKLMIWIPPLILVWVNLDWRFTLGLAAMCLFLAARALEFSLENRGLAFGEQRLFLPGRKLAGIAGAAGIASLISPNFYDAYVTSYSKQFGPSILLDAKSLNFRDSQDYLLMFLAMFASLVLGREHLRSTFKVALLALSVGLGFAMQSESWIVAIAAVAIIGEVNSRRDFNRERSGKASTQVMEPSLVIVVLILIFAAVRIPRDPRSLLGAAAKTLPVEASEYVRKKHLPGPLYNEIDWGGFIAWSLPELPVSIDERYEIYGEARTKLYYEVTSGLVAPSADPALTSANTILMGADVGFIKGPERFPNSKEIFQASFPGFREVYRDDLAVVLTKQEAE